MNAYELADELDEDLNCKSDYSAMLRQQANRIAELEKRLQGYQTATKHYREKSEQTNAEPVAWTDWENIGICNKDGESYFWRDSDKGDIPLYTTPQTKPLSDEEICDIESNCQEIWYDSYENGHCGLDALKFAREIEKRILGK